MLDKRKVSALGTYRSNFTKQILSFENHVEDVNALLEHLLYVCSTCKSIESAATSSRPEITFVLFPDVPDLLLAAMLAEGESSAAQIRQFEKSMEDTTLKMKFISAEALVLIEHEKCPESAALADVATGMLIEQIIELQDLCKLFDEECIRLRGVVSRLLKDGGTMPGPSETSSEAISKSLNHTTNYKSTSGWFDKDVIALAKESWRCSTGLCDKAYMFKITTQSNN